MNTLSLCALIQTRIIWQSIRTINGETQKGERRYIKTIKNCIKEFGGQVGKDAGSQTAIDLRDVKFDNDPTLYNIECKKINGGSRFMFNDSVLKNDVYYIFLHCDTQKVKIQTGEEYYAQNPINSSTKDEAKEKLEQIVRIGQGMLGDESQLNASKISDLFVAVILFAKTCVEAKIMSLFDFGKMFKKSYDFGSCVSRPRPNWTFKNSFSGETPKNKKPTRICKAIQIKGKKPCACMAKDGSDYCGKHSEWDKKTPVKCKGTTKNGKPCEYQAKFGDFCGNHCGF